MSNLGSFKMMLLQSRPNTGTVFSKDNFIPDSRKIEPFVVGEGALDFTCGSCGHLMLKSLRRGQVTKAIYKCPKCGSYNQIES